MTVYIVYKFYGTEKVFHGWTDNYLCVQQLLKQPNTAIEINSYELKSDDDDMIELLDYLYDEYNIVSSDSHYFKFKFITTKCGRSVVSSDAEVDEILGEVPCIYDAINKLIQAVIKIHILSKYVKDDLTIFLNYLIINYLNDIIKDYNEGEIDTNNSPIDIIFIMLQEGWLTEV